jgi:putative oxygen-independent coproporphyrinogen III oxidase
MPVSLVEAILQECASLWTFAPNCEITLEANPNATDYQRFLGYRQAGVNRLSLGIQSLNPQALSFLGRSHTADEACRALTLARELFERYSFDLIYALPDQSLDGWAQELSQALSWAGGHLSLYQLTIEHGTAFEKLFDRGDLVMPSPEAAEAFYSLTNQLMDQAGYQAYEVSNYARPGAESRHNLLYWRSQDVAAVGPGAHGRFAHQGRRWAQKNYKAPETWLRHVFDKGHGIQEWQALTALESLDEYLMMGLRLAEGLPRSVLQTLTARAGLREPLDHIHFLENEGLLRMTDTHLYATPRGRLVLNTLVSNLSHAFNQQF